MYSNQSSTLQNAHLYPAFNWKSDHDQPVQQLFKKAFNYCTQVLNLSGDIFNGEMQLFGEYKSSINISGDMEWHNPTYSLVLNLVHGLEDTIDDYILLYHGVKQNAYFQKIFKEKLKPGPGQAYRGQRGKNPKITVPNGVYGSQYLNVTMGYVDHTFPIVIQFATPKAVMTSSKNIFVVDQNILVTPIKLVFPFSHEKRTDQFQ